MWINRYNPFCMNKLECNLWLGISIFLSLSFSLKLNMSSTTPRTVQSKWTWQPTLVGAGLDAKVSSPDTRLQCSREITCSSKRYLIQEVLTANPMEKLNKLPTTESDGEYLWTPFALWWNDGIWIKKIIYQNLK